MASETAPLDSRRNASTASPNGDKIIEEVPHQINSRLFIPCFRIARLLVIRASANSIDPKLIYYKLSTHSWQGMKLDV